MRASKSATGSVKLIFVYLLLSSPVCSGSAGEPAVTYCKTGYWFLVLGPSLTVFGRSHKLFSFSTSLFAQAKYQLPNTNYQELFETPGISPLSARPRKHKRQRPNLRRKARGRPQMLQRLRCWVENFGFLFVLAIFAVVAIFSFVSN